MKSIVEKRHNQALNILAKSPKICYLCGITGADTRDHIPPRAIFPKRPRGQLITVPAHRACNAKFSEDDRLFRDLVIWISERSPEARKAWHEQVLPSFREDHRAKRDFQKRLTKTWVMDPRSNLPILHEAISANPAMLQRQVDRWTRGLYYHRFHQPLPPETHIEVQKLNLPELSISYVEKLMAVQGFKPLWNNVEPKVFSYFTLMTPEDREKGVMFYVFFETEVYAAFTKVL